MDLKPLNPSKDAPIDDYDEKPKWGRYNWSGWAWLSEKLQSWGVDLSEFSGWNDGEVISEATCRAVADAIEKHLPDLDDEHRSWIAPHIELWRTCGGYAQF